jgi:hypothetical protein
MLPSVAARKPPAVAAVETRATKEREFPNSSDIRQPEPYFRTGFNDSIMPIIDDAGFLRGEIGNLDTLLAHLEAKKQRLWEQEKKSLLAEDIQTVDIIRRHGALLERDMENFKAGKLSIMNPSIVPFPQEWRRHAGEKWLATFRHITKAPLSRCHGEMNDETNWVVLAALDRELRVARPIELLSTHDFFEEEFDCQNSRACDSKFEFGPEDPRLYETAHSTTTDPQILMVFNSKATYANSSISCPADFKIRVYAARIGAELRPVWTRPILLPGEDDVDVGDSGLGRTVNSKKTAGVKQNAHIFNVDRLQDIEKNWSPFVGKVTSLDGKEKQPQNLLVYSIEPHVILEVHTNMSHPRVEIGRSWNTSFPHDDDEVSYHGSGSPVRFTGKQYQPDVLLSVMHNSFAALEESPMCSLAGGVEKGCYAFFLYAFEPDPPFRILGKAERHLPLTLELGWNGTKGIAFVTQLMWAYNDNNDTSGDGLPDLWVLYGSGDKEPRTMVVPRKDLGMFLPQFLVASPLGSPTRLSMVCALGSLMLVALLLAVGFWASSEPALDTKTHVSGGQSVYDNARFFSCIAVVSYHYFNFYDYNYYDFSDGGGPNLAFLFASLTSPALVVFTVLSAHLSRGGPSPQRWRSLLEVSLCALLYGLVIQPWYPPPLPDGVERLTLSDWLGSIVDADYCIQWYLQALVLWRLMYFGCHFFAARTATPVWPLLTGAALICYSWNPFIEFELWSLNLAIVFLPAFVVGVLFPVDDLLNRIPCTLTTQTMGLVILGGFVCFNTVGRFGNILPSEWRFGPAEVWATLPDKNARQIWAATSSAYDPHISLFWAQGLFKMLCWTVLAFILLATLCPRNTYWFTFAGGKGALYAYLLHLPVEALAQYLQGKLNLSHLLTSEIIKAVARLLQVGFITCLVLALASERCIRLMSWLLKPTWLVNILMGAPPASASGSGDGPAPKLDTEGASSSCEGGS